MTDDFVRPLRVLAIHAECGSMVPLGRTVAEDWARDPKAMDSMFCGHCGRERPVGEFHWPDGMAVGS
jgi:hypothetical protein